MAASNVSTVGEASILVASKRVVYVGGLGEDVTQQILRSAMIPFGTIKSLDIPMDYKIGKTRGFAFVEFDDPEDGTLKIMLVIGCNNGFCLHNRNFLTFILITFIDSRRMHIQYGHERFVRSHHQGELGPAKPAQQAV